MRYVLLIALLFLFGCGNKESDFDYKKAEVIIGQLEAEDNPLIMDKYIDQLKKMLRSKNISDSWENNIKTAIKDARQKDVYIKHLKNGEIAKLKKQVEELKSVAEKKKDEKRPAEKADLPKENGEEIISKSEPDKNFLEIAIKRGEEIRQKKIEDNRKNIQELKGRIEKGEKGKSISRRIAFGPSYSQQIKSLEGELEFLESKKNTYLPTLYPDKEGSIGMFRNDRSNYSNKSGAGGHRVKAMQVIDKSNLIVTDYWGRVLWIENYNTKGIVDDLKFIPSGLFAADGTKQYTSLTGKRTVFCVRKVADLDAEFMRTKRVIIRSQGSFR